MGEEEKRRTFFIFLSCAPRLPMFSKRTRRKIEQRLYTGFIRGGRSIKVQLYTEWDDNHVCTSNLRVRREKLSVELFLMREVGDVFSPQA